MTKNQKRLIFFLLGVLVLMTTVYRLEWYASLHIGVWIFQIIIPISILTISCSIGSLFGKKGIWTTIAFLMIFEANTVASFKSVASGNDLPNWWTHILRYIFIRHDRGNISFHPGCGRWDEELFYTLNPGIFKFESWEYSTTYKVNSAGFRDSEESMQHPSILFLGDSYTMGWGVEQQQSFAKQVESNLGVPTLNAGISSYGTARELIAYKRLNTNRIPLIVLQYCQNDDFENSTFVKNGFKLPVSSESDYNREVRWSKVYLHYYPLKYCHAVLAWAIPNIIEFIQTANIKTPKTEHKNGNEISDEAVAGFFEIIKRIKAEGVDNIVIMEIGIQQTTDSVFKLFNASLKRHPIDGVYLFPTYTYLDKSCYFKLDDHINANGHKRLGKALSNFIQSNKLLQNHFEERSNNDAMMLLSKPN